MLADTSRMSLRRARRLAGFLLCLSLLYGGAAGASPFIYQQAPGALNGPSASSDVLQGRQAFDDFVLNMPASVSDVFWYGAVWPNTPDDPFDPSTDVLTFDVAFYNDDSTNNPESAPFFRTTLNPLVTATSEPFFFAFSADLGTRVVLLPDTRYWLSVLGVGGNFEFSWLFAGYQPGEPLTGRSISRLIGGGGDVANVGDLTFALAVPEPGTFALTVLGVLGLGIRRIAARRRRDAPD
jgi:hypothetical protein